MRTHGTFQEVYAAARYLLMVDDTNKPHDPVVRCDGDEWMLESGVYPSEDAVVEVSLDDFEMYWYESFQDTDFVPTSDDEEEFEKLYRLQEEGDKITVIYWRGTTQYSEQCDTYEEAMKIADRNQNAHGPQFFDAAGNRLLDNGYGLVQEDSE